MAVPIIAGDMGHRNAKAKSASQTVVFPSAVVPIDQSELTQITARNRGVIPDGFAVVNDVPVAYGDAAMDRGDFVERKGARRYTPDYYGTMAAISMAMLYDTSREVKYFGCYPSALVSYRDDLLRSVLGAWTVKLGDHEVTFRVGTVDAMDEPICGLYNLLLTDNAKYRQNAQVMQGDTLVIDIGGGTTDLQGVKDGGVPDYNVTHTIPIGINTVIENFKRSFQENHKKDFSSLDSLSLDRIMDAMQSGMYRAAGRMYQCDTEVNAASFRLVRAIKDVYENIAGSAVKWDNIALTGGGSAMLNGHLRRVLEHDNIILAEKRESMHLANVNGAYKLAKFYESEGML